MRRALRLPLGLAAFALAATGFADVAGAQTAPSQYLRWAGRPEVSAAPAAIVADTRLDGRRPNRVIPHGGGVAAPAPEAAPPAPRRTLTPANAWLQPPQPAAPQPAPPQPPAAPAPMRAVTEYLPEQGGRGQPAPAEVVQPTLQPVAEAGVDPMAPRRDAPIFRLQQQQPPPPVEPAPAPAQAQAQPPADAAAEPRHVAMVTANPADRPSEQGSRYYSVHRQSGRQPDPISQPEPTYVDALAVTAPVTLASQDLAQPEPGPTLIRDAQGRTRVQPAAPEGDYQ